ncbi:MAG: DNA repair protein RecO [Pseudomonadota bacterium]
MDWRDEGILLSTRPVGEGAAILDVLTASHGRHGGTVRGGQSARMGATLQPGTQLSLEWRARLEDQLGAYRVEPLRSRASMLMESREALAAFNSMAALVIAFVPEREPDFELYDASLDLVEALCTRPREWLGVYVCWEAVFLSTLGFGLDLSRCAATGIRHDLCYISPRTGRAVSREAGGPFAEKLLPLPPFMVGEGVLTMAGVQAGLRSVGWFLQHRVCPAMERESVPEARSRLVRLAAKVDLPPRGAGTLSVDFARWHRRMGLPQR